MKVITFDIETTNTFDEVASPDPKDLDISVVCIHNSDNNEITHYFTEDLGKLWPILESSDALVGYNSDHFDIPLLNKYYEGDPRSKSGAGLSKIKSIDLMSEIRKSIGRRIKLDDIVSATLGESKSSHGLQAIIWWRNGEKDKVVEYCKQDVNVTRKLYDYIKENGFCYYIKDGKKTKIDIDTANWDKIEEKKEPLNLGFGF
jgi:DEAD/DEAH box helicase domain-containing protein